jgi:hypothetical protein
MRLHVILLLLFVLLPATSVLGEENNQGDQFTFIVYLDNDGGVVKPNNDTDRYYTNGLKLTASHQPAWGQRLADRITSVIPLGDGITQSAVGYVVAQEIYTPAHVERKAFQPLDRPYAGWLYGGIFLQRQAGEVFDHFELNIGVVGPSSAAEDAQNWIHELFGTEDAEGWSHQLPDELGVDFIYRRKWRITLVNGDGSSLKAQLIPQAGITVGNVNRYIEGGATLRIGCHLPDDFGPGRLHDVASTTVRQDQQEFNGYLFVGAGGRYVEHNMFLEGSNYTDSHSVDEESWVGQAMLGVVINWRSFAVSYSQVFVTREFAGQNGTHSYGSILVSFRKEF